MKKYFSLLIVLMVLLFVGLKFYSYLSLKGDTLRVFLVYNPSLRNCSYVLDAYQSVLEEEGVPYEKIEYTLLTSFDTDEAFIQKHPAIILPDCALQKMNPDVINWFEAYLSNGGNLLLVYDVGIKDFKGAYLKEPLFTSLLGINYSPYEDLRDKTYTIGHVYIENPSFLGITPGKIDKEHRLIKGYIYGPLEYPVANVQVLNSNFLTLAEVILDDGKRIPALVLKEHKKGKLFYANLPLGHLKAYSDDLILRSVLRTFLFKLVRIPHILNAPYGVGGLVINWHIDSNFDWRSIPFMVENGYVVKDIQFSWHITAGDFRDVPGDGLGFDACGKGREYVEMLLPYGEIGSHGGWAHNWFSYGIIEGKVSKKDMEKYIKMNNECLENITKYKIREYSAPNGVHPQPDATKILEKLGMVAYYYTGDSGSSPNRTFYDGKMVSSKVLAFPVTPYERFASLYEMWKGGVSEEEVESFLKELLNYVYRERTIRLFYSHPYDIPHYPRAIKVFIEQAYEMQKEGKVQIKPMSYFADFLLRFLNTKYRFKLHNGLLEVELENQNGLEGITLAIPKNYGLMKASSDYKLINDKDYIYLVIMDNVDKATFSFRY